MEGPFKVRVCACKLLNYGHKMVFIEFAFWQIAKVVIFESLSNYEVARGNINYSNSFFELAA